MRLPLSQAIGIALVHTFLGMAALQAQQTPNAPTPAPPPPAAPPASRPTDAPKPAPPADPYIKKPQGRETPPAAAKAAPSKAPKKPELPPHHVLFRFETYRLPQAKLDALLLRNGGADLYSSVRKLVAEGTAVLESLTAVPTRSGQRATSESVQELIYPTEFVPPVEGRTQGYPSALEMRPLGERIELDPVEMEDGKKVYVTFSQEIVRLARFDAARGDAAAAGELVPQFSARKIVSYFHARMGVPTFVGTLNAPRGTGVAEAQGDGTGSVTFMTARPSVPLAPQSAPAAPLSDDPVHLQLVFRFWSLPREKARDLMEETVDGDALLRKVKALPGEAATLERLMTVITRSGQRCKTDEQVLWRYGTEFNPPQVAVEGSGPVVPAGATKFESRPVGWSIELEPVLLPDGRHVDLSLVPEHVRYLGRTTGHPLLERYQEQPLFATQLLRASVSAVVGSHTFLGTLNPPGDTGMPGSKDDGRTWFVFVKAALVP